MPGEFRVLIYAAGLTGVGQTRRAVRLAEYVCSVFDATVALVLTGVPSGQQLFESEPCQVVSPPEVVALVQAVRKLGPTDAVAGPAAAATTALLSVATEFDPDVFLTTTHAGLAGELRPLLKRLGHHGCRRILALRDIYWPPLFAEDFERLSDRDFDCVIVGGPAETASWVPKGLLDGPLASMVNFVGYLRPLDDVVPAGAPVAPLVRCQVGGGRDGYALAAALINLAPALESQLPGLRLHVSTGPLMSEQDRLQLAAAAAGASGVRIVVESWVADPFGSRARHSRPAIVISMAGYNACVEAAWFGTPTILSPRRRADDSEQEIRAHLFADRFTNVSLVDRPDPATLLQAVADPPQWRTEQLKDIQLEAFSDPRYVARLVLGCTS